MTVLLDELSREHSNIMHMLTDIKSKGLDTKEGQSILAKCKELMLVHFKKEEEHFYPVLRNASNFDLHLKVILDVLDEHMQVCGKFAEHFFEKYSSGYKGKLYESDFSLLYLIFEGRIAKEQNVLFVEYERVVAEGMEK